MESAKKTKGLIRIAIAAILFFTLSCTAFAQSSYAGYGMLIRMTRFEPAPVEPGSYAKVWLKIENVGNQEIPNFKFMLTPEFPFSLDPNETPLRDMGRLASGEQVTIAYKIRVSENAVEGNNPLNFQFSLSGKWMDAGIMVPVRTMDAIISIEEIKTIPESVEPGQTAKIILSLRNNADSNMRQVNLQLGLIDVSSLAGVTTVTELPFTPRKSNEKTIYYLMGGEEKDVEFELIINPDADSKPYKIPLKLDYYDNTGENYSKTYIIGLVVAGKPDLEVSIDKTTLTKIKSPGSITLKIVNRGIADAKFMNVKMEDNGDYKVLSANNQYLGNVDSDDFENAEFTIMALRKEGRIVSIPLTLEYKDSNNNDYREDIVITLDLDKAKAMNQKKSGAGTIILAIIIIVGGYIFYRRWKKKKEKARK